MVDIGSHVVDIGSPVVDIGSHVVDILYRELCGGDRFTSRL